MAVSSKQVTAVRRFNRFYTRQIGVLDESHLGSGFSLAEGRVLFELAHRTNVAASELTRDLGLDPGYLSRILKRFETKGLVRRATAEGDARRAVLELTEAGRAAFEPLNDASSRDVAALLERLPQPKRRAVVDAMTTIERALHFDATLGGAATIRPLKVGDIGWITHRQGILYAEEYGWDATYEALVAEILAGFVRNFDAAKENAWIAERDGEILGSVFLVRQSDEVAKLRLLYVEASARGIGLGKRLVDECTAFARAKGYLTMTLWTQSNLGAARAIYEKAGFRRVAEEKHHSFGKDLVGETWELQLREPPLAQAAD
jgi:DNA-binding MarR family transcriptional regulator/GNAT superfamily N-acetyltransferase